MVMLMMNRGLRKREEEQEEDVMEWEEDDRDE